MTAIEASPDWVLERLATEMKKVNLQIATALWGIWGARNLKVWEQKFLTPMIAMQWSNSQITQ